MIYNEEHNTVLETTIDQDMQSSEQIEEMSPSEEADDALPSLEQILPVLPLKNTITLPTSIVPVIVGRPSSIKAVENSLEHHGKKIFVTTQKNPDTEHPEQKDLFTIGTTATILQMMKMPNGSLKILVECIQRAKIVQMYESDDFLNAAIQDLPSEYDETKTAKTEAAWRQLCSAYQSYAKLNTKIPSDLTAMARSLEDKDCITDTIAVHANLSFDDRQHILETINLNKRMVEVAILLKKEIEILQAEQRIKGRIQDQVEKNQREYYLTEQIKAIHKELGREDHLEEIEHLRSTIKKLKLPQEVDEKCEKELRRLEQMPPMSAEGAVSKHYLDWIITLPWHKRSKDSLSLKQAEHILNKEHAGLKKVKDRIIEFVATRKFAPDNKRSPIICLVGPPGVGKTSLASSIAKSLNREFVRISLGGVRDEAEIRGHRRTYIGALPGKIIQAMRKAKTVNPVILLDEIDKMSKDITGDPSAAMLEVLDPEQNTTFTDHFLDVEYDLSQVMFITTANMIDTIPYPLFDRMEIIGLSGYTEEEKLHIAQNFLIPKILKEHNLTKRQFKIDTDILRIVIDQYTKEAGVRQLQRVIAQLVRKGIQELLHDPKKKSVTVTPENIQAWLGYPKSRKTELNQAKDQVGIVTGLAWTELGGEVLEIEIALLPGKGGLTLTGQLGEVMQESAQAAYSYIKANHQLFGITKTVLNNRDIHIHIPEGGTPKDGPSAGITICTAIISAFINEPVRHDIAMTGEVTLRGRVLAVGGIKEKILAAQQYNKTTVILPKSNENDVKELQDEVKDVTIVFAEHMEDVLHEAFAHSVMKKKKPVKAKKTRSKRSTTRK